METLEVGMYVRDEKGHIGKIINKKNDLLEIDNGLITYGTFHPEILKASHNIIDLIEDGDYINGFPVEDYFREYNEEKYIFENTGVITTECYLENTDFCWILERNIKTILTKEQFENNCYKIKGDE